MKVESVGMGNKTSFGALNTKNLPSELLDAVIKNKAIVKASKKMDIEVFVKSGFYTTGTAGPKSAGTGSMKFFKNFIIRKSKQGSNFLAKHFLGEELMCIDLYEHHLNDIVDMVKKIKPSFFK